MERETKPPVSRETFTRKPGLTAAIRAALSIAATITVIDGDTVEQDGVRWRLAGIDAPEIHRAKCPEERQRGIIGAARLITLLTERGGRLDPVQGKPQRDKYGRQLGTLHIGDAATGEAWGAIAIREGHAVAWDGHGKQPNWCGGSM